MARRKNLAAPPAFEVPAQPPETPEEQASSRRICEMVNQLTAQLRAKNLAVAVALAQQAACGHGPLVGHFSELGRRYSHLLARTPKKEIRRKLHVVEGGRS